MDRRRSYRAGTFLGQPGGYAAFIPAPLPPVPPIAMTPQLTQLLSRADQAIGRLDGISRILPNPDLFVAMYVRQEAVDSSQIEGTQSTLEDVLAFELDPTSKGLPSDVEDVVNYVRAMNYGLDRLSSLPLSLRLIREIHGQVLASTRGSNKDPGEFRKIQNWLASGHNQPIERATFVPPPPPEMNAALAQFESFLHTGDDIPALIHCGLCHAQFETIHPFLDGNGRVGRLLIAFLLVHRGILHRPLLYISTYLKHWRADYYNRLTAIRDRGDWEGWIGFFLGGVIETAEEASALAIRIVNMKEGHRVQLQELGHGANELRLLDQLFKTPLIDIALVSHVLEISYTTASKVVGRLQDANILEEVTGQARNRKFRYHAYWTQFSDPGQGELTSQAKPE
jgi:Fic family protein